MTTPLLDAILRPSVREQVIQWLDSDMPDREHLIDGISILKRLPELVEVSEQSQASSFSNRLENAIDLQSPYKDMLESLVSFFDSEDLDFWPTNSPVHVFAANISSKLIRETYKGKLIQFQLQRYLQLKKYPHLLRQLMHGLTRRLDLSHRESFIDELVAAGRRKLERADEHDAFDETDCLHIALSYKHAAKYYEGGTLTVETAQEAYDIIRDMSNSNGETHVRIWVDQNLHRYNREMNDRPWYQRGFIPYATMHVVTALSSCGGFSICRRSPWIWIETLTALSANGIFCRSDVLSTASEVIESPRAGRLQFQAYSQSGHIIGIGSTVASSIQQTLRYVSWWSPDVFEHREYEFRAVVSDFAMWARAQLVRFDHQGGIPLSEHTFGDSIVEKIAWMRSLPTLLTSGSEISAPYGLMECSLSSRNLDIFLLSICGSLKKRGEIYEMCNVNNGLKVFSFAIRGGKVILNVTPTVRSGRLRVADAAGPYEMDREFIQMKMLRNGYMLWSRHCQPGYAPEYDDCGQIFPMYCYVKSAIGKLPNVIPIGKYTFKSEKFARNMHVLERIFESHTDDAVVRLRESGVLVLIDRPSVLQDHVVDQLRSISPRDVENIAHVQSDHQDVLVDHRNIGTVGDEIMGLGKRMRKLDGLRSDQILVRCLRLGPKKYYMTIMGGLLDCTNYSMKTVKDEGISGHTVLQVDDDDVMTLEKLRMLKGDAKFRAYDPKNLSAFNGFKREGGTLYTRSIGLNGSDMRICENCCAVFCAANNHRCAISSDIITKKLRIEWIGLHTCRAPSSPSGLVGIVA